MTKVRKRLIIAAVVIAAFLLAALALLLSFREELYPYAEPDLPDIMRAGMVAQRIMKSVNADGGAAGTAELIMSPQEFDSVLLLLQSRQNPWLTRSFGTETRPFVLRRKGDVLTLEYLMDTPLSWVKLCFNGEFMPVFDGGKPGISCRSFAVGNWPLSPEYPEAFVRSFLDSHRREFGHVYGAVTAFEVLPDGYWRVTYRPGLLREALQRL